MTFNPDLVFEHGLATGDVKYKLTGSEWNRDDLYQAIAFATIYESSHSAIVGFRDLGVDELSGLGVGKLQVHHLIVDRVDWVQVAEWCDSSFLFSIVDESAD